MVNKLKEFQNIIDKCYPEEKIVQGTAKEREFK